MAAVSAVYLVRAGFTRAPAITAEGVDVADLRGDPGQTWRVMERYDKPFQVCRWAQPPVQAVLSLMQGHGLISNDVDRVEILTFHDSLRLATRPPKTTGQAQYSTAFPARRIAHAVVVLRDGTRLQSPRPKRAATPRPWFPVPECRPNSTPAPIRFWDAHAPPGCAKRPRVWNQAALPLPCLIWQLARSCPEPLALRVKGRAGQDMRPVRAAQHHYLKRGARFDVRPQIGQRQRLVDVIAVGA